MWRDIKQIVGIRGQWPKGEGFQATAATPPAVGSTYSLPLTRDVLEDMTVTKVRIDGGNTYNIAGNQDTYLHFFRIRFFAHDGVNINNKVSAVARSQYYDTNSPSNTLKSVTYAGQDYYHSSSPAGDWIEYTITPPIKLDRIEIDNRTGSDQVKFRIIDYALRVYDIQGGEMFTSRLTADPTQTYTMPVYQYPFNCTATAARSLTCSSNECNVGDFKDGSTCIVGGGQYPKKQREYTRPVYNKLAFLKSYRQYGYVRSATATACTGTTETYLNGVCYTPCLREYALDNGTGSTCTRADNPAGTYTQVERSNKYTGFFKVSGGYHIPGCPPGGCTEYTVASDATTACEADAACGGLIYRPSTSNFQKRSEPGPKHSYANEDAYISMKKTFSAAVPNTSLTGCPAEGCQQYSTLDDAKAACQASTTCNGVIYRPNSGAKYEIRSGTVPTPSTTSESSYLYFRNTLQLKDCDVNGTDIGNNKCYGSCRTGGSVSSLDPSMCEFSPPCLSTHTLVNDMCMPSTSQTYSILGITEPKAIKYKTEYDIPATMNPAPTNRTEVAKVPKAIRYISINSTSPEFLNFSQVAAWVGTTNVALNKTCRPTTGFSYSGNTTRCATVVDGDYSLDRGWPNIFHSSANPVVNDTWMDVDFGSAYNVERIEVYNRGESECAVCVPRLAKFRLHTWDATYKVNIAWTDLAGTAGKQTITYDKNACPTGSSEVNGKCYNNCPAGKTTSGTQCLTPCPAGTTENNGFCIGTCNTGDVTLNGKCYRACATPDKQYTDTQCYAGCVSPRTEKDDSTCTNVPCPSTHMLIDGQCYPKDPYSYLNVRAIGPIRLAVDPTKVLALPTSVKASTTLGETADVVNTPKERNGAKIGTYDLNASETDSTADTNWIFTEEGAIINTKTRKCIDAGGANVYMWVCHNGMNQKWDIDTEGRIISRDTTNFPNTCLTLDTVTSDGPTAIVANLTRIRTSTSTRSQGVNHIRQKFILPPRNRLGTGAGASAAAPMIPNPIRIDNTK